MVHITAVIQQGFYSCTVLLITHSTTSQLKLFCCDDMKTIHFCCCEDVLMASSAFTNLFFCNPQTQLPELDTAESTRTRAFVGWLREQRPFYPTLHVIKYVRTRLIICSWPLPYKQLDITKLLLLYSFITLTLHELSFKLSFFHCCRDESQLKANFMQNMVEDRTESALSYYEFLLHVQQQISK